LLTKEDAIIKPDADIFVALTDVFETNALTIAVPDILAVGAFSEVPDIAPFDVKLLTRAAPLTVNVAEVTDVLLTKELT
jgi:hypothetical protein